MSLMVETKQASAGETSLRDYVTRYEAVASVQGAAFLGDVPALVHEDGTVALGSPANVRRVVAHAEGAVLVSAATSHMVVTGGDDGLVVRTRKDGTTETIHDAKGKWIDALALREDGAMAWSVGKTVMARTGSGGLRDRAFPSTARGLAFAPKGYRLAVAHYGGASLWFPNTDTAPDQLEWRGSHLSATFSTDGRFLVTAMQENALHGWRVADKANMRMSGYPSKVRSLSWSADGAWLATSGADSCVIWPFRDKDGPMNKAPRETAVRKAKVSRVAFHPSQPLLAIGYEDGWVLLCRLSDASELLVHRPDAERGAVSALAWSARGDRLLFGSAEGTAGLLTLPPA